mmetsp:Transcript_8568/g.18857  ORF Transcript_8568/g.18857 Transcript_8568/m.18857 type:complete len:283 (-) Transcript_8568:388-1236(-)
MALVALPIHLRISSTLYWTLPPSSSFFATASLSASGMDLHSIRSLGVPLLALSVKLSRASSSSSSISIMTSCRVRVCAWVTHRSASSTDAGSPSGRSPCSSAGSRSARTRQLGTAAARSTATYSSARSGGVLGALSSPGARRHSRSSSSSTSWGVTSLHSSAGASRSRRASAALAAASRRIGARVSAMAVSTSRMARSPASSSFRGRRRGGSSSARRPAATRSWRRFSRALVDRVRLRPVKEGAGGALGFLEVLVGDGRGRSAPGRRRDQSRAGQARARAST